MTPDTVRTTHIVSGRRHNPKQAEYNPAMINSEGSGHPLSTLLLAVGLSLAGLCLSLPLSAADAPATGSAATGRVLPTPEQDQLTQLAKAWSPETEVIWLETQQESFLGLYLPASDSDPAGAALLLPHDRTSPDWPGAVHSLRLGLPEQGWQTLAIAVPAEPEPEIPERGGNGETTAETAAEPAAETAAEGAADSSEQQGYAEQLFERIEAGLRQLESRGASRFMLIGVGSGGYWAARYLSQAGDQRPFNLTLIDARPPTMAAEPTLSKLIAELKTPTLDLYHGNGLKNYRYDIRSPEYLAGRRLKESRRQQRQHYIQRRLPLRPPVPERLDQRLLASFRGIFRKHMEEMQPSVQESAPAANEQSPGQ